MPILLVSFTVSSGVILRVDLESFVFVIHLATIPSATFTLQMRATPNADRFD